MHRWLYHASRPWQAILRLLGGVCLGFVALPVGAHIPPQQAPPPLGVVPIQMISNRADLISGGDALLEVQLDPGTDPASVRIDVDGRDVSAAFRWRANGRYEGLVTGLNIGRNLLSVRVGEDRGGRIAITNHPAGGPVFSGPQIEPWICATEQYGLGPPADPHTCHAPPVYRYLYKSSLSGGFESYDPDNPPADMATTTTDEGVSLPYIVRIERGTLNRGIYDVAVLFDPAQVWDPFAPQAGWNGKLVWLFGDGAATGHVQAPPVDVLDDRALSRGFMVASSGLNVGAANLNDVVSSETLMMLGEHIFERYGEIRYTLGRGCGSGAALQLLAASNYPNLLNGVLLECSLPDIWTAVTEVGDCGLLERYFNQQGLALWALPTQRAAASGFSSSLNCLNLAREHLPTFFDPGQGPDCAGYPWTYDQQNNPQGERCLLQDYQKAVFGRQSDGAAPRPFANRGVQYGLAALLAGEIIAEQFLDLNAQIGCYDQDGNWQAQRCIAEPAALRHLYQSGRLAHGAELGKLPIVDLRAFDSSGESTPFHSLALRARLDRDLGYHEHQVIWSYSGAGQPPPAVATQAFRMLDDWMAAVEGDLSGLSQEEKVLNGRPAEAIDACFPTPETQVTDPATCALLAGQSGSNPRVAAGAPLSADAVQCVLRPPQRQDYAGLPVALSDPQWERLQAIFADGVCDYAQPGELASAPLGPYQRYSGNGGGTVLGVAPGSTALDAAIPAGPSNPSGNGGGLLDVWLLLQLAIVCALRRRQSIALSHSNTTSPAPAA